MKDPEIIYVPTLNFLTYLLRTIIRHCSKFSCFIIETDWCLELHHHLQYSSVPIKKLFWNRIRFPSSVVSQYSSHRLRQEHI